VTSNEDNRRRHRDRKPSQRDRKGHLLLGRVRFGIHTDPVRPLMQGDEENANDDRNDGNSYFNEPVLSIGNRRTSDQLLEPLPCPETCQQKSNRADHPRSSGHRCER